MTELVTALAGAAGAAAVVIPVVRTMRRAPSKKVEDQVSIVGAAETVIQNLTTVLDRNTNEIKALRAELGSAERRIDTLEDEQRSLGHSLGEYRRGVDILIAQLRRLGVTPDWTPPHTEAEGTPEGF